MKKFTLFCVLFVVFAIGFSPVRYSIKAELNISGRLLHVESMGLKVSESGKAIPQAGLSADIPFS